MLHRPRHAVVSRSLEGTEAQVCPNIPWLAFHCPLCPNPSSVLQRWTQIHLCRTIHSVACPHFCLLSSTFPSPVSSSCLDPTP